MTDGRCILLAAGGTGGHLFPAHALAEALVARGYSVDLVSDERVSKYGIPFPGRSVHEVSSGTVQGGNPVAMGRTLIRLGKGVIQARSLLARLRPAAVVGFGGYPTFPPIVAARLMGIPAVLHEQNAVMGRANRMLARRASALALSFPQTSGVPEVAANLLVRVTGNPVRGAVLDAAKTPMPQLDGSHPVHLLVFGGSQGARFFSDIMPAALSQLEPALRSRLRLVQQCREEDLDRVRDGYRASGVAAELASFFTDLPARIAASHLVIARAGASTISELTVLGRPGILVPLPHSIDNDQLHNARRLEEAGGGWCIEQKDLTPGVLAERISNLFTVNQQIAAAGEAARRLGRPDAVDRLADLVCEVAGEPAAG